MIDGVSPQLKAGFSRLLLVRSMTAPRITTDLLRGLLVAGYRCYMTVHILPLFAQGLHSDTPTATAVSDFGLHSDTRLCVRACRLLTQRAPKTSLLLLVLLSTIWVLPTVLAALAHRWVNETIILQWVVGVGAVGLAYVYWRRVSKIHRPNSIAGGNRWPLC